jgi:hypothetical protein
MSVETKIRPADASSPADRVAGIDWTGIVADLNARGAAVLEGLLSSQECRSIAAL